MKKLDINLENCYGIGKLSHSFDFSKSNSYLVYAPNGTMKSSLAKTFSDISKNDKKIIPCDRIYQSRKTTYEVKIDGSDIVPEIILVIDAEDSTFDASAKISNFIASKELKKKYDEIYQDLDKSKSEFIKKLKGVSQSSDCENEFIETFHTSQQSFFESLETIITLLDKQVIKFDFRYNDVFDKKGNVNKFLEKNQSTLKLYIDNYQSLISKSTFFKKSDNSFGTFQANEIIKSTEDNSFFDAGHKFVLEGDLSIDSSEQLKTLVDKEITNIVNDPKLKEAFDKVDKAIGANVELRAFKKVIEDNNLLLIELENYEDFKKKVWLSYISELKADAKAISEFYKSKKKDLETIIKEAKKEFEIWKTIISTFNSRFYVPFNVLLTNQEDIILKQETPNLTFQYQDEKDLPIAQNKVNLLKILSKGEQRAYYILQLLFDIEARRANPDNLLIFDDIADSFDYKNKYAIIEYIKDLHMSKNFKIIILTHNFDFYRTISSRLDLKDAVYMIIKNQKREISIQNGQYRNDVFKYLLGRVTDPKVFISLISFVRNVVEYSDSDTCTDYLKLTSCLHKKADSDSIKANDVFNILKKRISSCNSITITFGNENIIDLILKTAKSITQETPINEILLENKIVLSIAIRLIAEKFMISKITGLDISKINSNQTRELFNMYSPLHNDDSIRILDKVNLMTPENIHMNAFMYEPLIDMSLYHLKDLHSEVESLK
jgi:hypothetical protein